jgi:hypothetical protein
MTTTQVRVGQEWLRLREPADAAARAVDLVEEVRAHLTGAGPAVIHDLGCGSGSMARWVAGHLPGPQHWILHDRDPDLLTVAAADALGRTGDGPSVTRETRCHDVTRLGPGELAGASLVTASALLDMLTAAELERLVAACAEAHCPVLIALSVTGRVALSPEDPLDSRVASAFNAHQRRIAGTGRLLGPEAVAAAVEAFTGLGWDVVLRPSPWRLGRGQAALAGQWFRGWLAAACEQQPELYTDAAGYARRRFAELAAGRLSATVDHQDLLARPR